MLSKIKLPKIAETTDVMVIEEWLVSVGDDVTVDQVLASIETDKVTVDLPSPVAGRFHEILVAEGEEARTGDHICVIET